PPQGCGGRRASVSDERAALGRAPTWPTRCTFTFLATVIRPHHCTTNKCNELPPVHLTISLAPRFKMQFSHVAVSRCCVATCACSPGRLWVRPEFNLLSCLPVPKVRGSQ